VGLWQTRRQSHARFRASCCDFTPAHGDGRLSVGSDQDRSRIHCLCQCQSWQDQQGLGETETGQCSRRSVHDDERHKNAPCTTSRRSACHHRPSRGADAGLLRQHARNSRAHKGRKAARIAVRRRRMDDVQTDANQGGEQIDIRASRRNTKSWSVFAAPHPAHQRMAKDVVCGHRMRRGARRPRKLAASDSPRQQVWSTFRSIRPSGH
jgi:hypothetical protein